jgi:hypothetical protein
MSLQSSFASTRRANKEPLTRLEAKKAIQNIRKGNFTIFAQLLDIKLDFYKTRIAAVIRRGLRGLDTEPLTGEVVLYGNPRSKSGLLYSVGERPRLWHYSAAEMIRKTTHIRHRIRTEQPALFPFDRLESMTVNDEGLDIYLPSYWELEQILEAMQKHEHRKIIDTP